MNELNLLSVVGPDCEGSACYLTALNGAVSKSAVTEKPNLTVNYVALQPFNSIQLRFKRTMQELSIPTKVPTIPSGVE